MASDSGDPKERLDERLVAARDSALLDGEEVIAQEAGDHGQAIVLTNMRVLIIKVGITATGVSNGKVVGEFPISQISAVNVRKGPLGAVIQVCAERKETEGHPGTPDNVIVFTGSKRMRECEIIASKIESVLGKPVGRFEPPAEVVNESAQTDAVAADAEQEQFLEAPPATAQEDFSKPGSIEEPVVSCETETAKQETAPAPVVTDVARGGRQPRSLAEEMFAEMVQARNEADKPLLSPPSMSRVEGGREEATEQNSNVKPEVELRPNPKLPKPARRRSSGNRVFALFGLLIAALAVGVAAIVPLKIAEETPTVSVDLPQVTNNTTLLRRQLDAVSRYASEVRETLEPATRALADIRSALGSNKKTTPAVLLHNQEAVELVWRRLDERRAPPGLAGAKELIVSGLFVARTALANLAASCGSNGTIDLREFSARVSEARSLIDKGLAMIENTREEINKQLRLQKRGETSKQDIAKPQ